MSAPSQQPQLLVEHLEVLSKHLLSCGLIVSSVFAKNAGSRDAFHFHVDSGIIIFTASYKLVSFASKSGYCRLLLYSRPDQIFS